MLTHSAPLLPSLVRRYIAWTERHVVLECRVLRIPDLQLWERQPRAAAPAEILPLERCGSEHLLRRVHNETAADSPGFVRATLLHAIALRGVAHHDRSSIFLARADDRYVGYCIGRIPPGRRGRINGLAVHPDFRGRGIGRDLLRTVLLEMKRRTLEEAVIHVHPENQDALRFYLAEGFVFAEYAR